MNVTDEIKVLTTVVETLTPLEPDARQRVVDYVCNVLEIGRIRAAMPAREEAQARVSPPLELGQSGKRIPPQQYLRDYNYKIMTKRIAVLAVYLERELGKRRFDLRDITEAFRAAKEPKVPAHSQYGRAVVMGFLAKEGDQFYATSEAEHLVDDYKKQPNAKTIEEQT